MASSFLESPNSSAALPACGLVSFIWPSSAPVISIGDMPPISAQMYFQVQPLARLMSRIFSVNSARSIPASYFTLALSHFPGGKPGSTFPENAPDHTRLVGDSDSAYISYSTRTVMM
jgi:hypothetical protein